MTHALSLPSEHFICHFIAFAFVILARSRKAAVVLVYASQGALKV